MYLEYVFFYFCKKKKKEKERKTDDGKGNILRGSPDPEIGPEMIHSPELNPKFAQPEHNTIFRTFWNEFRTLKIREGTSIIEQFFQQIVVFFSLCPTNVLTQAREFTITGQSGRWALSKEILSFSFYETFTFP